MMGVDPDGMQQRVALAAIFDLGPDLFSPDLLCRSYPVKTIAGPICLAVEISPSK